MRAVVHIMMFLAWLLYGAMPAQAAFGLTMPMRDVSGQTSHAQHTDHVAPGSQPHHAAKGDPCPHRGSLNHAPFCAACIVLIPQFRFAHMERLPHDHPKRSMLHAFIGSIPAPPLPPPRA